MANTVKDPDCGLIIDPTTEAGKSEHKGQIYYFCSLGRKKSFDKDPEKSVGNTNERAHHLLL